MTDTTVPFTPDRYRRIHDLVDQACGRPEDQRHTFLSEACGPDRRLFDEVTALLEARAEIGDEDEFMAPGTRIGPYRVVRELGRGGMGAVHLAVRADESFEKQVAIKLVRPDGEFAEMRSRFLLERRILAALEHPNIARLLDAGTTDTGRPYFIMEYVDGVPLTTFADRRRLSIRERIELFRSVCAAVDYAHRKLIIHRDLKPTNVLVTADGVPKLLDFGIAKVVTAGGQAAAKLTTARATPGTPLYASPEQLRGDNVDARADVYALGVILFELLTDWSFVRESEPDAVTPPSEVIRRAAAVHSLDVVGSGPEIGVVVACRRTTTRELTRDLRGDLDAIALAAVRDNLHERYPSVQALSDDLQCYLERRPVSARSSAWSYRALMSIRRHRVAAAGVATLVLASLFGFTVLQRRTAPRDQTDSHMPAAPPSTPLMAPSRGGAARAAGARPASMSRRLEPYAPAMVASSAPPSHEIPGTPTVTTEVPSSSSALPNLTTTPAVAPPESHDAALAPQLPADAADRAAIADMLARIAVAYSQRNTVAIKSLYPSLSPEELAALDRTFLNAMTYRMAISDIHIQVKSNRALVTCQVARIVTSLDGTTRDLTGPATFQLVRLTGRWLVSIATFR